MNHWADGGGNALVDLATGTGKSCVIAELSRHIVEADGRVMVLTHVKELIRQNAQEMLSLWPRANIGIYSAGLNKREAHRDITFAGIQTVWKRAPEFGRIDLILIDECHLVPMKDAGRYRRFLSDMQTINPTVRVGGLTATPYRLGEGRLDRGDDRLFEETLFTYGIADGIRDGFLSPLVSKAGVAEIDVTRVAKSGGEFKASELERAARTITEQAVEEIVERGADRKGWLVFCSGVQHANETRDAIRRSGISCETVTGETPAAERERIINAYKAQKIRCLASVGVLTTGFNARHVDMVVFLRSTLSTSLYVQIIGRGTRLYPDKENCLVLDYGGNVRRHGPVDAIEPREPGRGSPKEEGEEGKVAEADVRAKECPDCDALVHVRAASCPICGHEWATEPRHEAEADGDTPILTTEAIKPRSLPVVSWSAKWHEKPGKPPSMRVDIVAGLVSIPEWVCFEHGGFAAQKACQWWTTHGGAQPFPETTVEAIERFDAGELMMPATVSVKPEGRFSKIVGRAMPERAAA
ncbi:DEAD/DEAH box helicase [Acuticoccus sp. M5D2P5]|nr:DEAD/DEAH box helicase [Acuticoccus kalidii]